MANWLQEQWLKFTFWHIFLMPLSWVFGMLATVRKWLYKNGWLKSVRLSVPVVIIGNINVGGTGKTPLVIWLAEQLQLAGYKPGIVSRGYGGNTKQVTEVMPFSNPFEVGDEPVLIATRTSCPVFVSVNRIEAGQALLATYPTCNIIISDDGLQHYRLQRDVEIIVYDSIKGFGNGALLPAGPLRESKNRLKTVDAVVSNGSVVDNKLLAVKPIEMQLESTAFYNALDKCITSDARVFSHQKVLAIAGIGNPDRFFKQLRLLGLNFQSRAYSDHYAFKAEDFAGTEADIVVMTEKDAVKCRSFARPNFWVLPVNAVINNELLVIILNKLNKLRT
ncbi:MAG: tetraacyldisaccharide 4'-kinase [Methylotenera sp.]|nr:tetraacyldisaccharide 4'-kinase [Methylotenera sp.]MDP1958534.1 tetraacyldisaccharide 4'-kinase [Methylotenera sp.]MDP3207365.1 tetraacyldisaccharide 4'-kinase [Methylotenera sp.]MDP3303211.1 tetraacyldisaccharide 4'-kinase [Methylotenera sp.]MDP3943069.1 tetraacyldisaccharide 4'-kinase [Methylotenera sp.]